jgi:hypothetical protein
MAEIRPIAPPARHAKAFDGFGALWSAAGYGAIWRVYHGTTLEAARSIARNGFDEKLSEVGYWGKGCYVSTKLSIASEYSVADAAGRYVVICCDMLPGQRGLHHDGNSRDVFVVRCGWQLSARELWLFGRNR